MSFRQSIAPILLARCQACHNQQQNEGGYSVDSFADLLKSGDSDETPIEANNARSSELLRRLVTDDTDQRMPLDGEPLAPESIALVRAWIDQGASYDAKDPSAPLAAILPVTHHPAPPQTYAVGLPITALAFSEDSSSLMVGGYHELLIWDLADQHIVHRVAQSGERTHALQVAADRIYVASGSPGQLGEVRVFRANPPSLLAVPLLSNDVVLDLALSPDDKWLAASGADQKIHLIDTQELRVTQSISSHSDWVQGVTWLPDGRLVSASRDRTAKIIDVWSAKVLATYAGHTQGLYDVCVSPQGDIFASSGDGGEIHVWTVQPGEQPKRRWKTTVSEPAFRLLGQRAGFWGGSQAGFLRQSSWSRDLQTWSLGAHEENVVSMAINRRGNRIATGTSSGMIRVWNLASGILEHKFVPFPRPR